MRDAANNSETGSYFLYIQKVGSTGSRLDQPADIPHSDAIEAAKQVGSRLDQLSDDPWVLVPRNMRSIVRVYINSEMPQDRARADELCDRYQLNYAEMRKVILAEMCAAARNAT